MSWMILKKASLGLASCFSSCAGFILLIVLIGKLTHSGLGGICGPYGSDTATFIMLLLLPIGLLVSLWMGLRAWRWVASSRMDPVQKSQHLRGTRSFESPTRSIDQSVTRKLEEEPFE